MSEKQALFALATLTAIPVASCGTLSAPIEVRIVIGEKTASAVAMLTTAEQALQRGQGSGRSEADIVEAKLGARVLFFVGTETLSDAPG
jgi:hypothetical protein